MLINFKQTFTVFMLTSLASTNAQYIGASNLKNDKCSIYWGFQFKEHISPDNGVENTILSIELTININHESLLTNNILIIYLYRRAKGKLLCTCNSSLNVHHTTK